MTPNKEQKKALEDIQEFRNSDRRFHCLFAGAGCGKTFVINQLRNVVKLATTNEAALLINGTTVHSFFGFGIKGYKEFKGLYKLGHHYPLIIIDECSMLPMYIYKYIVNKTDCKVLFVGDPKQLVVNIAPDYRDIPASYLTQNMRAKNEKIENLTSHLSECVEMLEYPDIKQYQSDEIEYIEDHKVFLDKILNENGSKIILSYRNKLVEKYAAYGRSLTVHKAQGKSYEIVFFDARDVIQAHTQKKNQFNNPIDKQTYLRMLNVGLSRAMHKIYIFIGKRRHFDKTDFK